MDGVMLNRPEPDQAMNPEAAARPSTHAGELAARVARVMNDVIALRRHLQAHPELSGEEQQTAAHIAGLLEDEGIPVRRGIGGHGRPHVVRHTNEHGKDITRKSLTGLNQRATH